MSLLLNLDESICIHIFQYLNRTNFMNTRQVCKHLKKIGNHDIFWRILNLTDIQTVDHDQLYEQYCRDNYLHIYNLSQTCPTVISIPRGLLPQLSKTRLIII